MGNYNLDLGCRVFRLFQFPMAEDNIGVRRWADARFDEWGWRNCLKKLSIFLDEVETGKGPWAMDDDKLTLSTTLQRIFDV